MPSRHYLNALRSGTGTLPAPKPGIWDTHEDFLKSYADSVDIQGQFSVADVTHNIPSVFQRPIQFQFAMSNPKNPLHDALVGEWRGLMAVLALGEWLDLQIDMQEFNVPDYDEEETSWVGNETCGDLHFRAMLRNQRPLRPAKGSTPEKPKKRLSDWEKWWVIRCNGALLGATSPWTVLYTASHYVTPPAVPWQKDGLLIDPILHYDPKGSGQGSVELSMLHAWVSLLLDAKENWMFPQELGAYENLLSVILKDWKKSLDRYKRSDMKLELSDSKIAEAPFSTLFRSPIGLQREDSDLYENSDLYLDTNQGRVLVLYDEMTPKVRIHRGVFADRVNLSSMKAEGQSFRTTDGVVIHQAYIIPKRLFFPPRLIRMALSSDAFRSSNFSTPLQPSFFRYFDHDGLKGLEITESNGAPTASLKLRLHNGKDVTIRRSYTKEEVEDLKNEPLPAMALWPKEYDTAWRESFAAYATDANNPTPVSAKPLMADGSVAKDEAIRNKGQKPVRLWHLETPAIGFALRLQPDAGSRDDAQDAGLVLRHSMDHVVSSRPGRMWRVGVDFGTSSTTVMVEDGDGRMRELPFDGHLLNLIDASRTHESEIEIERNLYPREPITPPFRTLLYKSEETATLFGKSSPFTMRFGSDIRTDVINKPIEDLKWGMPERQGTSPLNAYLEALTRYITWEARSKGVSELKFFWSYPTSLPKGAQTVMQDFWSTLRGGSWHPEMQIDVLDRGMSESEASCRAITEDTGRIRSKVLSITVDIGGGSTDIAFWSDRKLLDQVSFKVAGNDMLDRTYLTVDTLQEFYRICTGQEIPSSELKALIGRPEIYVNGALSDAKGNESGDPSKHPICDYIRRSGKAGGAPWVSFRSMIYLFFTGICYYMGVQARSFGNVEPQIDVFFGGRGSAMLTWLTSRKDEVSDALEKALLLGLSRPSDDGVANVFPQGTRTVQFFGQAISHDVKLPRLKTEVAKGLLVMDHLKLSPSPFKGALAGEVDWRKGSAENAAKVKWNERLGPEQLSEVQPPVDFSSTMIGHFLSEVIQEDMESLERFNLDADLLRTLAVDRADVVNLIQISRDAGENLSQPIFAFELKALMHKYAQNVMRASGTNKSGIES